MSSRYGRAFGQRLPLQSPVSAFQDNLHLHITSASAGSLQLPTHTGTCSGPTTCTSLPLGASASQLALDNHWERPQPQGNSQSLPGPPGWVAPYPPQVGQPCRAAEWAAPALSGVGGGKVGQQGGLLLSGLMRADDVMGEGSTGACEVASTFLASLLDTAQLQAEGIFDELCRTLPPADAEPNRYDPHLHPL